MSKAAASSEATPASGVSKKKPIPVKFHCFLIIIAWSIAVFASLGYNTATVDRNTMDAVTIQARTAFEKDVNYRRWNSMYQGVLLRAGKDIQPNPYLAENIRSVALPDGQLLVTVNPAFMTRLVHEIGALQSGVEGHITSNNPIRPENRPDPWEAAALGQIERGEKKEVTSLEVMNGREYLRFMGGLVTEEGCLNCHAQQGYKIGDIRGGISVSAPMDKFGAAASSQKKLLIGTHLSLWVLGLIGIGFGGRNLANIWRNAIRRRKICS